jgi:hypothetical protein
MRKTTKKLSLMHQTIRTLSPGALRSAVGGMPPVMTATDDCQGPGNTGGSGHTEFTLSCSFGQQCPSVASLQDC